MRVPVVDKHHLDTGVVHFDSSSKTAPELYVEEKQSGKNKSSNWLTYSGPAYYYSDIVPNNMGVPHVYSTHCELH